MVSFREFRLDKLAGRLHEVLHRARIIDIHHQLCVGRIRSLRQ